MYFHKTPHLYCFPPEIVTSGTLDQQYTLKILGGNRWYYYEWGKGDGINLGFIGIGEDILAGKHLIHHHIRDHIMVLYISCDSPIWFFNIIVTGQNE